MKLTKEMEAALRAGPESFERNILLSEIDRLRAVVEDAANKFVRESFEAGQKVEREACAETAEAAASDANKYDIANSIRARSDATTSIIDESRDIPTTNR